METLAAIAIIAVVAGVVVWLFVRRPHESAPAPPPPPAEPPGELSMAEQVRRIARDTIKIEVTSSPTSKQRYAESYPLEVVGESGYQVAIRALAEAHPERGALRDSARCEVRAMLVPEPANPHDATAVRVEVDDRQVGYLSRADAAKYRSLVGLGRAPVAALIVGGWNRGLGDRGSYGVRLAFRMDGDGTADLPSAAEPIQVGTLEPRNDLAFPVDVMGEVRYQYALERICAARIQDGLVLVAPAKCVPEDDCNVRVEIGGATVGYLTSMPAWIYTMTMDGATSECRARIYAGQDHGANTNAGLYGVRLDLVLRELPAEIAPHQRAHDYPCEIMGESNCQPALRAIVDRRKASKPAAWVPLVMARLEPDTSNPPRVDVLIDGQLVGYLSKATSRQYCASASAPREVPAWIMEGQGGDGRRRYGVNLEIRFDKAIKKGKADL
jgi:hypothetical protein